MPFRPLCARVNNRTEALSFAVYMPKVVEFLRPEHPSSMRVLTRSLCMLLFRAVEEVHPKSRLRIEHSVSRGFFCRLFSSDGRLLTPDTDRLLGAMRRMTAEDIAFVRHERPTKEVLAMFRDMERVSKVELLSTTHELYTTYYTLSETADSYYGPLAPSTGYIGVYDLLPYADGMLLLPPDPADMSRAQEPVEQRKMYEAFTRHLRFNRIVGVSNVGELNKAITERRSGDLINLCEALHEREIAAIADRIAESGARVVLLAGPSSSGKTTTTKRLAVQLMTNLLRPKMISMDDYFVNREQTPVDPVSGDYDYESLYALDLKRFNSDIRRLLDGEEICLPTYSFELGRRVERYRPLRLGSDEVLLIEGIHGLNPGLTPDIPQRDVFKVYISALTSLSIDDHNWIPTTDNRLLRRIVRDHKYRHTSALSTIRRWQSVRRGEEKWIFPFQENADATFNSSLLFEIAVMKEYAEPLLRQVPHDVEEYSEAYRLLRFLSYFEPVPADQVPPTSLLREFLGGSSFHY